MGNRTREEVRDPAGALAQARTREYSNLNRLAREIGAAAQVIQYAYDPQGNLTGITDPLNKSTTQTFDALNRLATQTDPAAGVTRYAYNPLDQLTGLTDPRNLTTRYALNALDELARETSPDPGITERTYDAAGNVATRTDARGQSATYTYDALNRVTRIQWSDQVHTFSYDAGSNGIGRPVGCCDPSDTVGSPCRAAARRMPSLRPRTIPEARRRASRRAPL